MFSALIFLLIESASAHALGFKECVDLASQNNPELLSAEAALQAQEEALSGSYSGFFPNLNATLSATHYSPKISTFDPKYVSGISASYNLFSGLKDLGKVHQNQASLELSKANLDSIRAKVSLTLRQAFIQYLYANENVSLSQTIYDRRSQNERLVRAQYESGKENEGSYLLSKSLVDQADYERMVARDQLTISAQNLAHVIGRDELKIEIEGEVPSTEPPTQISPETLLELTPAHRTQIAKIKLAESSLEVSRSGFMPSLDLNASLNYTGQSPTLQQNQQMGLGLTLTFPLFSGLSTVHEYRSNRKLEEAAQKTGISVDFDTLSQIRQTFYTFQESTHKLKVDLTTLNAATIRATIARKRYNTGLLVFEQWDIIENDLINRQKSALASKRDRIIAESSFRQALGLGDLP